MIEKKKRKKKKKKMMIIWRWVSVLTGRSPTLRSH